MEITSLKQLDHEPTYFSICKGLKDSKDIEKLTLLFKEVTTKYYYFFEYPEFIEKKYPSEDKPEGYNVLQYILPTIRSVYIKFFIDTPTLFKFNIPGNHSQYRLELFQLQFNLLEFVEVLSKKYIQNHKKLNDFENIDQDSEILRLIVDNYVSQKVQFVLSVPYNDLQSEIRDSIINKQLEI
jgi:hypothetical protein